MSNTISVRLPEDLAAWLKETVQRTGQTQGEVVHLQLEKARSTSVAKPWMTLAGKAKGLPLPRFVQPGGICPAMRAIAGTGFLVAFLNAWEEHQVWVIELAERVTPPVAHV